jgi:hypothetical protein
MTFVFGEERGLVIQFTEGTNLTDPSRAQALARRGLPAGTVETSSSVSSSTAQQFARRARGAAEVDST